MGHYDLQIRQKRIIQYMQETNYNTHTIIPSDLYHPLKHKFAAIRHLTNRLTTYTMNNTDKEK